MTTSSVVNMERANGLGPECKSNPQTPFLLRGLQRILKLCNFFRPLNPLFPEVTYIEHALFVRRKERSKSTSSSTQQSVCIQTVSVAQTSSCEPAR